jgi:cobaltochelatase CobS
MNAATNPTTDRSAKALAAISALNELMDSQAAPLDADAIREIVKQEIGAAGVTRIEIRNRRGEMASVDGRHHPKFAMLCKLASSFGADGFVPSIFISGEASSGKTTACKNLAKGLGLAWHFNGAISMPHEMLGFIDAAGHYHRTPFREAYEHGGVYTFDEVDRSDPVALLAVNPHLANGVATFPDGQIQRHPDCVIIATANTWGTGADAQYSGATKLDAAFLSRFPVRLRWNIDLDFERAIVANDGWTLRVQAARKRAQEAGLKVMIDTRMCLAGAAYIADGMLPADAAECTYLANLNEAQRGMVEG